MKNNLTFFVFIVIGIFSVTAAAPNLWGVIRSGFLRVGENEAKSVCL